MTGELSAPCILEISEVEDFRSSECRTMSIPHYFFSHQAMCEFADRIRDVLAVAFRPQGDAISPARLWDAMEEDAREDVLDGITILIQHEGREYALRLRKGV